MAQHVILNHPTVTAAADDRRADDKDWSPRTKLLCVLTCGIASWALVLTPFFLIG